VAVITERILAATLLTLAAFRVAAQESKLFADLLEEGYRYTVVAQGVLFMEKEGRAYVCKASGPLDGPVTLEALQRYYRTMACAPLNW
jgi:hypothetical protein